MQSPDHPSLRFVEAAGFTRGRPDGPPLWIVVHAMEAGESSARAESVAAYFANPPGGRAVSAHYCVDDNSVVQCVRLADSAWTVGNRPGNNRGINWELAGVAAQSAAQWRDSYSDAMLRRTVPYIQADAAEYSIPLRRCSVADLRAMRPGVTSHYDLGQAFGGTTHTDPGPNFPWAWFIALLNGEEGVSEAEVLSALTNPEPYRDPAVLAAAVAAGRPDQASLRGLVELAGGAVLYGLDAAPVALKPGQLDAITAKLDAMDDKLDQILAAVAAGGGGGGAITVNLSGQVTGTLTSE